MRELSSLAAVPVDSTRFALWGVGDRLFTLPRFTVSPGQRILERVTGTVNLRTRIPDRDEESQWEGVAVDGAGRIFILEETPGRIFAFDAAAKTLIKVIHLKFDALGQGEPAQNSRGEGLVLLKNGHVLVAQEKQEPALIEFGPEQDQPEGVSAATILAGKEEFQLSQDDELVPLKIWPLDDESSEVLPDISELALGPEGKIYLLSDEGMTIGVLEGKLRIEEEWSSVRKYWKLPKEASHPEGLAFLGPAPIVGCDDPSGRGDLFLLDPLP